MQNLSGEELVIELDAELLRPFGGNVKNEKIYFMYSVVFGSYVDKLLHFKGHQSISCLVGIAVYFHYSLWHNNRMSFNYIVRRKP